MMFKLFPKRLTNLFKIIPKHDSEKQRIISSKGRPEAPRRESKVAQRCRNWQGSPRRRWNRLETRIVSAFFAHPPQGVPTTFPSPPAAPKSLPKVSQMVNTNNKKHYPTTLTQHMSIQYRVRTTQEDSSTPTFGAFF